MRRSRAALGSAVFFVVAPGTVVGLIPWLITHWEFRQPWPYWHLAQVIGGLLICVGLVPAVSAFVEFVKAGGTPMPIAPTQHLVVSGFNRYLRNPMYFGLVAAILGQALLFGSPAVLIYAAVAWVVPAAFVRWYERSPPWHGSSALSTRLTGVRCPPGGPGCARGHPASTRCPRPGDFRVAVTYGSAQHVRRQL
jgi:protein-S-isoprenylcysteine O-methyltransferase Ste14